MDMPSRSLAGGLSKALPTGLLPTPGTLTGEIKVSHMTGILLSVGCGSTPSVAICRCGPQIHTS